MLPLMENTYGTLEGTLVETEGTVMGFCTPLFRRLFRACSGLGFRFLLRKAPLQGYSAKTPKPYTLNSQKNKKTKKTKKNKKTKDFHTSLKDSD